MRIQGIHLGGLGTGTSQTGGYMLSTALPTDFDATTEGYTWREVLPERPNTFGGKSRISPFQAQFRFAPLSFIASVGRKHDWLAELLFATQKQADTELTSALSDTTFLGSTTVDVEGTSDLSAGQIVYVGLETMKIDSVDSGTQLSVIRGYYRSPILEHDEGANLYTSPPTHRGRRIIHYTYDTDTESLEARNRGQITGSIEMDKAGLSVPARQTMSVVTRAKLNTDPSTAFETSDLRIRKDVEDGESEDHVVSGYVSIDRKIRKDNASTTDTFVVVDDEAVCHLPGGEQLVKGHYLLSQYRRHSAFFLTDATEVKTLPYEVLVVDRAYDEALGSVVSHTSALADVSATAHGVEIEDSSIYPYHPLAIAAALLLSTDSPSNEADNFDIFRSPHMGADLSELFSDDIYATLHELIQKTPYWSDYLGQLLIGWDGKTVDLMDVVVDQLMLPYGFFFGRTNNGKLTVRRVDLTGVDAYGDALDNEIEPIAGRDATYRVDNGVSQTVDTITATVGDLPTQSGRALTLDAETGQPRSAYRLPAEDTSLDLSTIPVANAQTSAVDLVVNQALAQHYALQRLTVAVTDWTDGSLDYGLGERVTLDDIRITDAWLVDPSTGERVSTITNDVQFVGQIIEVKENHQRGRWELTLLLNSAELVRRRAPAGIISEAETTTTETRLEFVDPSPFDGAGFSDVDHFALGDDVVVWSPDGSKVDATPSEVTDTPATGAPANTIIVGRELAATPSADDIVRLAHLDTDGSGTGYVNTSVDANVALVYTYLADSAATLGDAGDDAHIYGV